MKPILLALAVAITPIYCLGAEPSDTIDVKATTILLDDDGTSVSVAKNADKLHLMLREVTKDHTDKLGIVALVADSGVNMSKRQALRVVELMRDTIRRLPDPESKTSVQNERVSPMRLVADKKAKSQWKKGPMPEKTFGWGAVQLVDQKEGFYFADFRGTYVFIADSRGRYTKKVPACMIKWYDNCIAMSPPHDSSSSINRPNAKFRLVANRPGYVCGPTGCYRVNAPPPAPRAPAAPTCGPGGCASGQCGGGNCSAGQRPVFRGRVFGRVFGGRVFGRCRGCR